jgi:alanine-synthesizing transaminase
LDPIDLTISNLSGYAPEPLGTAGARAAVSEYYARRNDPCSAEQIVITASTSEAYHTLFCVLADPGDRVLVPTPSYPLFSYLADIAGVHVDTYPLHYAGEWQIGEVPLTQRTKAIVLVSPNNPTGSVVRENELRRIEALGLPLIVDEVFADYLWRDQPLAHPSPSVLSFRLSGLSKVAATPELKLGWMRVAGPESAEAIARIEIVNDSFLSVAAPVQEQLPDLLRSAEAMQPLLRERLRTNLNHLRAELEGSVLAGDGGFSAIVRFPATQDEDAWLRACLTRGLIVQPGHFFDIIHAPHVVVSLLPDPNVFARGVAILRALVL